jgi:hypothetical protein
MNRLKTQLFSVFPADKVCSALRIVSHFLTRAEFSRKDAEALWKKCRVQGTLEWLDGPGRWTSLLEELG